MAIRPSLTPSKAAPAYLIVAAFSAALFIVLRNEASRPLTSLLSSVAEPANSVNKAAMVITLSCSSNLA